MKIRQWQGPGYKVTSSEDVFFNSPLRELTLFRFSTPYFEVEPHPGEFSLKLVLRGRERYVFHSRNVTLHPGEILLVNAGETYASHIGSPTESFSVFFCPEEVHDAVDSLRQKTEVLLDTPNRTDSIPEVAQIAFSNSAKFRHYLNVTILAIDAHDTAATNEAVRLLLLAALDDLWGIAPPYTLAHIRRRTTRDELLARVHRARALIVESDGLDINLGRLAYEACLSQYHFLRVFSMVFGETPVAYARRLRLEHARDAIEHGEEPRTVARHAGYKDVRSFLRAYQRMFGSFPRLDRPQ